MTLGTYTNDLFDPNVTFKKKHLFCCVLFPASFCVVFIGVFSKKAL